MVDVVEQPETLRFACTACGKCCSEPPEMTLLEAAKLGDVFVPALVYRLTSLPRDDNEAAMSSLVVHKDFSDMDSREFVSRLRTSPAVLGAGALVVDSGWDHHIAMTARAWTYADPSNKWCPALGEDRKQCTIHERRPHTCRTVPVRYDVPEGLLVRAFRAVVDKGRAATVDRFECDVSDAAPVLLRDGVVVDKEYAKAREVGTAAAIGEKELAAHILQSPLMPPLRELFTKLRQVRMLAVSFHGAIASAHDLKLLDDDAVKSFCNAQVKIIEREIATAVARKRREDRDTTTRFRTILDAYRVMLARLETRSAV
jgi:Fe-S-cluster containining protein